MLIISSLIFVALALCLCIAARRALALTVGLPPTTDWVNELSVDRYRPMVRLLNPEDIHFLREQPGFTSGMEKIFRKHRYDAARGYLRDMATDFVRICSIVKLIMAHSQHDRPDLASTLIRSQIMFGIGTLAFRLRLLLFRYGLPGFEWASMFDAFEGMRLELRTLLPAAGAA